VPPTQNDNAGPANVHARSVGTQNVGVPWDLGLSTVGRSPTEGFDALMVHAATLPFTVQALAGFIQDPGTSCTDAEKCSCVEDALALNRVSLGFMNVTRTSPPTGFIPHPGPAFGTDYAPAPRDVPFFLVRVWNIVGNGDAVQRLADYSSSYP